MAVGFTGFQVGIHVFRFSSAQVGIQVLWFSGFQVGMWLFRLQGFRGGLAGFQDFRFSGFQVDVWLLGFQDFRLAYRFSGFQVLRLVCGCEDFRCSGLHLQVFRCSAFDVSRCSNGCSGLQVGIQVFRYAGVQVFRHIQVGWFSGQQSASVQVVFMLVCRFLGVPLFNTHYIYSQRVTRRGR